MNRLRYGLIAGICAVSYLLFLEWNAFQDAARSAGKTEQATISSAQAQQANTAADALPNSTPPVSSDEGLPSFSEVDNKVSTSVVVPQPEAVAATLVNVQTDSFDIAIDTLGGDIVRVALPKHLDDIDSPDAFTLMNRTESQIYVAQSGLIGPNGTDTTTADRPVFSVSSRSFTMSDNEDTLEVDLVFKQAQATITKRFTFTRDSYLINIDYIVQNKSSENWRAAPYGQIRRNDFDVESSVGFGMQPFLGAALTTKEKNYNKMSFSDIAEDTFVENIEGGWVSMVQHYFISAWVPDQQVQNKFKLYDVPSTGMYILEYTGQPVSIAAGQTGTLSSAFYAGPKNLKALEEISPYLDLTLDYSFLWFIAKPLFFALEFIHGFVGNWGIAIILLTMLIKLVFLYPSAMSYRSMAKMRKLQPMMAELKERYGEDRQKMSTELMKLYKTEKVNPLGGCLPILLQMPVFISLYWVLMESVELRHAPFFLWITDLSIKDPYFILPLVMGFTMFIQQKLNPTPPDPMQAKVMQMMPFFFTILFLMFPAGLVLYWVVNNTLSITQQYIITRQIEKSS